MGITDLHNHLMPGVDDGAQTDDEARAALERMRTAGVTTIITTPHLDASLAARPELWDRRLEALDGAWARLSGMVEEEFPELEIHRGVELKLDTPEVHVRDRSIMLADGPFVLMEFPFMTVPPRSVEAIEGLRLAGVIPIIAHPERYSGVDAGLTVPAAWKQAGAYLQVNGGSLMGRYGRSAEQIARALLEAGAADYVASDYHARGEPSIVGARERLVALDAPDEAIALLMDRNPRRVLDGAAPLPVPRIEPKKGLWARLMARLT